LKLQRDKSARQEAKGCIKIFLPERPACEKFHEDGGGLSNLLIHIMTHVKLHIPGPVEVSAKTFQAFCSPMIGHRGQGFKDLYAKIQPQLQQLLATGQLVYLSTSSAWGVMEGAVRNLVRRRVLNCMCGAFSDKWLDVSKRCGKEAEALQVPWGSPILPAQVEARLATGQFDALTLIHNETSTGVMSPIYEIAALKKKFPDVMFIVDAVSSMSAIKLEFDALGVDVLLAGTQKAFAMPPGLAIFVCSPAALAKAAAAPDRGYYFDFVEFQKNAEQSMTPSTPSIGHVYALASKLEDIFAEGLEARFARHKKLAGMTRAWAAGHGFTFFPEAGFESVTLTCVNNGAKPGGRVVDAAKLQKMVKEQGFLIDGGYGKIKGTTFRISNMGDETEETMNQLFAALDGAMKKL
jgi:aspartate aminotransferase-like enzyme